MANNDNVSPKRLRGKQCENAFNSILGVFIDSSYVILPIFRPWNEGLSEAKSCVAEESKRVEYKNCVLAPGRRWSKINSLVFPVIEHSEPFDESGGRPVNHSTERGRFKLVPKGPKLHVLQVLRVALLDRLCERIQTVIIVEYPNFVLRSERRERSGLAGFRVAHQEQLGVLTGLMV